MLDDAALGPFPGQEDEPVPAREVLDQQALPLYWAALDTIDAIYDALDEVRDPDVRSRLRVALRRTLAVAAPMRAAAITARMESTHA